MLLRYLDFILYSYTHSSRVTIHVRPTTSTVVIEAVQNRISVIDIERKDSRNIEERV
jgi:hypothetical protein